MTALFPMPLRPTENWKTSSLYLPPVLILRDALHDLAEGNAAAVVSDRDLRSVSVDLDFSTLAHDELVHRVVDDLLEHHVDAVGRVGAVADPADVHAGAQPDVLERIQRLD